MKCRLVLGLVALLPLLTAYADLTNGLVAYYPLAGNANDLSGNGNTGTLQNVTFTTNQLGIPLSAALFSGQLGINSAIDCPTLDDLPYLPITYSCWFRLDDDTVTDGEVMTLVGRERVDFAGTEGAIAFLSVSSQGFTNELGYTQPLCLHFNYFHPLTNQWYHTALTIDTNALLSFYVNGSLYGTTQSTLSLSGSSLPFRIGASTSADGQLYFRYCWAGAIDDVRVYNRPLSASEVQLLYAVDSGPQQCTTHAATASAVVTNGFVIGAILTDIGCGYTNPPTVEIIGGGGTGATATATITNGFVVAINITGAGSGYTNTPTVLIGSPPFIPWLSISVSQVTVTEHVVLGHNYILESSTDLVNWTPVGTEFTAQSEVITQTFNVGATWTYYRIVEEP